MACERVAEGIGGTHSSRSLRVDFVNFSARTADKGRIANPEQKGEGLRVLARHGDAELEGGVGN
jgi:hypothetical protein